MKKFLSKMWAFITNLWNSLDGVVEKIVPIAINVVNAVKTVNENSTGDIIELVVTKAIPGKADDVIIAAARIRLKAILPKILLELNIIKSISSIKNPNDQLKAILSAINMSSDAAKNIYYHGLSALILESLADGKLTWSESVHIAQYYFDNK